jgi:hypothetical protein
MLHTLRSAVTQVVEEQDRWTEHVGTHVSPVTRTQLFERAREEATSASTILRRALLRELARVEADHSVAFLDRQPPLHCAVDVSPPISIDLVGSGATWLDE